jgi:hypothetical protein
LLLEAVIFTLSSLGVKAFPRAPEIGRREDRGRDEAEAEVGEEARAHGRGLDHEADDEGAGGLADVHDRAEGFENPRALVILEFFTEERRAKHGGQSGRVLGEL